jgi:hypothetical protein
MGSTFVTLKEAARLLRVSESSIQAYVAWGYLRASKKKTEVRADDVDALIRERNAAPPLDKVGFAKLFHENRVLRAEVDVLKRIANIRVDPLKLTDSEIASFYRLAQDHVTNGCPLEHEEGWVELLSRIQHSDLIQLEKVVNDQQPWRPFYNLAAQLSVAARKHLRSSFETCQGHIKIVAGVWLQTHGGSPSILDTLPSHVLARLQRLQ